MNRRWLILILLLLPTLLFPGALPGPLVVSADDHLAAQHAFWNPAQPVHNAERSDPALQFRALRDSVREAWAQGKLPLWNEKIFGGAPLLADGQSAAFNPAIGLELILPDAMAHDLRVWLTLIGLGLGVFLLAECLGASPWGAAFAATGSMLSGFAVGWLLHPHAMAFAWAPWITWAGLGVLRRPHAKTIALLAICWAGACTAGHPQTALHGLLFSAAVWACLGAPKRENGEAPARLQSVGALLGGLALGGLLAAPALLPFLEQVLSSTTLHSRGGNRLPAQALLSLIWPDPFGHPARESWRGVGGHLETNLHVGATLFLVAITSLRTRTGRRCGAIALGCYAIALGAPLLDALPIRNTRLIGFGALSLALAAGTTFPRSPKARWLLLVLLLELLWARRDDQVPVPADAFRPAPAAWTEVLTEAVGEGRVVGLGWALQPNTAALLGLDDLRGYDLPLDPQTEALMRRLDPRLVHPWFPIETFRPDHEPLFQLADVRVIAVVPGDERAERSVAHLPELDLGSAAPIRLFRFPTANTRVWLDHHGVVPIHTVRFPRPERVEIDLTGAQKGTLLLADRAAPGWTVTVDGMPAEVETTKEGFRSVRIDTGDQAVVFQYSPRIWKTARACGGLGLLGLIALGLLARKEQWRFTARSPTIAVD